MLITRWSLVSAPSKMSRGEILWFAIAVPRLTEPMFSSTVSPGK